MDFEYLESYPQDDFDSMEFEFPADQTIDNLTFQDAEIPVAVKINVGGERGTSLQSQTPKDIEALERITKQAAASEAIWVEAGKEREQKRKERTGQLMLGEKERMERLMAKTVALSKKTPRTKLGKERAKKKSQMTPAKGGN